MNTPTTIDARVGISELPPLIIRGRITHPIIQGGMGVGVSDGNLAGSVAREGGVGTLSSVGLAWIKKYKPLLVARIREEKSQKGQKLSTEEVNQAFYDATLIAARQEIEKAQTLSGGHGALWLNTMVAIHDYKRHVELACQTGIHGIVSGAGLPLELPKIASNYPNTALIPILSNQRGVNIVMKKWEKLGRLPDAIVLEDPTRAGGHLGAADLASFTKEDIEKSKLEVAVPETTAYLQSLGLEDKIPVIAAGGIVTHEDIKAAFALGAGGVQLGTRFLASEESGANSYFKQKVLDAKEEADMRLYVSNALLPARALNQSGVFVRIHNIEAKVRPCVENCLIHCGYRDGKEGSAQMCILDELSRSVDEQAGGKGLMFTGVSALRINTLLSVKDIMDDLLARGV